MFSFHSQIIKTDVTAVSISDDHLLVGVGGYVHIFDKHTYKIIKKINVFEGQKIYGIILNKQDNKILLYGGRCIKILEINEVFTEWNEIYKTTSDWILNAKWIDNGKGIVTVSMHNKLLIWNQDLVLISEVACEEKCILYSATICYEKFDELVILSGTVFSDVLIWRPTKRKNNDCIVLKRLQKHHGVIFSIDYNETAGYICSSSDDRSAVLWKIKNKNLLLELQQDNIEIHVACKVYGHLSRIFRCQILSNCFITGGEDSVLNIWSFDGTLIRKIETHQGGPIWALHFDEQKNLILTGGGDCGVTCFPIHSNFKEQQLVVPNCDKPKIVGILGSNNLVVFSENGLLLYYMTKKEEWLKIKKHEDLKTYCLLEISSCRSLILLAGFHGQIYIYKEGNGCLQQISLFETKNKSRIFSMHWLNCKSFLVCQDGGKITLFYLKNHDIFPISNFILPVCKERWTTTALFVENNHFVVGDRKGNLHLFEFGKVEPIQTVKKVHTYLGVTNLLAKNEKIISLGRNGSVKTFLFNNKTLQLMSSDKLPFTWLVNIIEEFLLAFSGNNFVIWNYKTKRIVFEKACGGGHRSWDLFKNSDNSITFSYIKNKIINKVDFQLNDFLSVDLIEGYQVKEINSVKIIKVLHNYITVSGGEDTTLRINLLTSNSKFENLVTLKSHLSSIRAIVTYQICNKSDTNKESYLVFSAGGRAQIVCWILHVFTENGSFKNVICSEQHSYYKIIDCNESEMRIMDLAVAKVQNNLTLFCACSDGNVKIFFIDKNSVGKYRLNFYRDLFHQLKCILKLCIIHVFSHNILVTMATDGKLLFWDVTNIFEDIKEITPFYSIPTHQSGINSKAFKTLRDNLCLFLTGGDDNAIVLNLFQFKLTTDIISIENIDVFVDISTHCAQITGVFIFNEFLMTASIDQRVALFEWKVHNKKITCTYLTKYNTAVADLQGLECFETHDFETFIYGKGIEYIKIKRNVK